ncbi:MAG: thiamine biosynthesis protein ThiS [Betaproteobacteria bacterium TMED41]|nr:MAG: thiamine biosynthesis protein ThiS [Betaproteobacteria bacterium TMED41]|tara:strand:- start:899 stop:1111 length:213 start_codon:yes stop_codon:yes gene_type:complete
MMKKISVSINNKHYNIDEGSSLEALIVERKFSFDEIATAVNNSFVPRSKRSKYKLKNRDSVIIFSAITGG